MLNRFLAVFFLLITVMTSGCFASPDRLCLRQACYAVDIAQTPESREQGLMFREGLPPMTGMFFVFEREDVYAFWMKNMKFPIDIIWIDAAKRVVYVASRVPPCTTDPCTVYNPSAKAKYVLEIPAGDAIKYGIVPGDTVR